MYDSWASFLGIQPKEFNETNVPSGTHGRSGFAQRLGSILPKNLYMRDSLSIV